MIEPFENTNNFISNEYAILEALETISKQLAELTSFFIDGPCKFECEICKRTVEFTGKSRRGKITGQCTVCKKWYILG